MVAGFDNCHSDPPRPGRISVSKGRPKINANKFIINEVGDIDGDGEFNLSVTYKDICKG